MADLPIRLTGTVVPGDRRGRELGYPTANVDVPAAEVPEDGIYGGWLVRASGSSHLAAISIGRRPTYYADDAVRLVEAYVLDFADDLYGEAVEIILEVFVRPQARFASTEALVAQIARDVTVVSQWGPSSDASDRG